MPIRVFNDYNCSCEDLKGPRRTSRPYSLEGTEAVTFGAELVGIAVLDFLTTRPYPVEDIGQVGFTASTIQRLSTPGIEAALISAQITDIELRSILDSYEGPPEAVETAAEIVDIELRQILKSYAMEDEAVEFAAEIVGITLDQILVSNEMADEAVEFGAILTNIGLTTP
jgi:hypothetical protein